MNSRPLLKFGGSFILFLIFAMIVQPSDARSKFDGTTYISNSRVWMQRTPDNSPSARSLHEMAYDSARGVSVLFGGYDGTQNLADTWEWDGANWTLRTPLTSPPARGHHAMAYDSARNVVVLFGGSANDVILGDTWEWDGTNWTERTPPTSPPVRWIHSIAYDSARDVVVLFGGIGDGGALNDTWEWDGMTWIQQTPPTSPSWRWGHNMAYDSTRGVTVLFGGRNNSFPLENTWEWNGITWVSYNSSPIPSVRDNPTLVFDSERGVTVLFGGFEGGAAGYFLDDTWEWDGTIWTETSPSTSPSVRDNHAMVYDSVRGVSVMFGGEYGDWPFTRLADTWDYGQSSWANYLPLSFKDFIFFFAGPWEKEDNDTISQANKPIISDQNYFGYHNDSDDYFGFHMTKSGTISIDMNSDHTAVDKNGHPVVQTQLFYNSSGNLIDYQFGASAHIEYHGSAGWYYVRIYTVPDFVDSSKEYTLKVTYP